jgi:hypothetical protein
MNTQEKIREIFLADIEEENRGIRVHEAIAQIIREAKQPLIPSKRIVTKLEKLFPASTFCWESNKCGSWYEIVCWDGTLSGNTITESHMLCYHSDLKDIDSGLTVELFEDRDGCYGYYAKERNRKRQLILDTDGGWNIAEAINEINKLHEQIEEVLRLNNLSNNEDNPSYYKIIKAFPNLDTLHTERA